MTALAFLGLFVIAAILFALWPQRARMRGERANLAAPSHRTIEISEYRRNSVAGNFPLDNLSYNLITLIHEKSKGLEAFDKYIRDAQSDNDLRQLFERIRQQDVDAIQQLQQHLGRAIKSSGERRAA